MMDHNGNGWIRHAGRRTPPLIVAALMAVIALMASGAHAAAEETRTGVKSMVSADAVQAPVHRKYVKDNGDGTYDLTLNVRGDSPWLEAKNGAPKDVVLVVEKSSLMNKQTNSGRTRWDAAKHTATALVQRLLTSENGKQDAARRTRVALVNMHDQAATYLFGTRGSYGVWTVSAEEVLASLAAGPTTTRTTGANLEDALHKVKGLSFRNEAERHVILLTSGETTMRNSHEGFNEILPAMDSSGISSDKDKVWDIGKRRFYGGKDSDFDSRCRKAAVREGKALAPTVTTLALVNSGDASTGESMKRFAGDIGGWFVDAGSRGNPGEAAHTIAQQILSRFAYRDAAISDMLSEYVEPVGGNGSGTDVTLRLDAVDGAGHSVMGTDGPAKVMQAKYDSGTKTLSLGFPSGTTLTSGVTYQVTLTIKPTDTAHRRYAEGRGTYPHVGDADTDAPGKTTSSGKRGFHANRGNAKLDYAAVSSTNGVERTLAQRSATYGMPVVQVLPTKITLVAQVDNTYAGRVYGAQASEWQLWALDGNGMGLKPMTPSGPMVSASKESTTQQLAVKDTLVTPGTYKLGHRPDPDSTYPYFAGYTSRWECTDSQGNASNPNEAGEVTVGYGGNLICTVTFTAKSGKLTWHKVDERNNPLGGSRWSLTNMDEASAAKAIGDNAGEDADTTSGKLAVTGLMWGNYKLTETQAPQGYQLGNPLTASVMPVKGVAQDGSFFTIHAGSAVNRRIDAGVKPGEPAKPAGLAATGAWATGGAVVMIITFAAAGMVLSLRRRFMRR